MAPGDDADDVRPRPLSQGEGIVLADIVADVVSADLPLSYGLRAAAAEVGNRRLARQLHKLAGELEQGVPLEQALTAPRRGLPRFVAGMIAAALRTGQAASALTELAEHQRQVRDTWSTVVQALAYPLLLLIATFLLAIFASVFAIRPFGVMFEQWGLEIPAATMNLIWWGDVGVYLLLRALFVLALIIGGLRLALGAARFRLILSLTPLLGGLWFWSATAEMARLLSILMRHGVPLPEALQLAGAGMRDANVSEVCQRLATGVEQGHRLSSLIHRSARLPQALVPLVHWGEQTGRLPEALAAASDMFASRVFLRAMLLKSVLGPFLFLIIWGMAAFVVIGLFLPFVSLISALS